jgi:hypothetical protein
LQNDVSDLQEIIVGFEPFGVGAENMLQVQAATLLTIESLVFNVPAMSFSFCGKFLDLAGINCEIGDLSKCRSLVVNRFLAFDGVK